MALKPLKPSKQKRKERNNSKQWVPHRAALLQAPPQPAVHRVTAQAGGLQAVAQVKGEALAAFATDVAKGVVGVGHAGAVLREAGQQVLGVVVERDAAAAHVGGGEVVQRPEALCSDVAFGVGDAGWGGAGGG